MAWASAPTRTPSRSPQRMMARTCRVKGTGESGIAIWAATAVTAAINAARVMVDAFNANLSANLNHGVRPAVAPDPFYHRSLHVSGAISYPTAGVWSFVPSG